MAAKTGKKAVVLLSGGMDSAVAAALAKARGRRLSALSIDYGQTHRRELAAARWQAKRLGLERHATLKLPLGAIAQGALVDGSAINTKGVKKGKPSTYVSFRNGVFLAAAASFAEAVGASEIWGGWCFSDQGGYPDCRPAFFRAFEKAVQAGTWAGRRGLRLKIEAPLGRLSKAATLRLGAALDVDFRHTWTCYRPLRGRAQQGAQDRPPRQAQDRLLRQAQDRPCGRCDACRLRRRGFDAAGLLDPLK